MTNVKSAIERMTQPAPTAGAPRAAARKPGQLSAIERMTGVEDTGAALRIIGAVKGGEGKDTVPAYLTAGEYVLPKNTVAAMGGSKALDKLVAATNDKKPGGKPVKRSVAPFKPRNAHERMTGFESGGMVNPLADAQADHQRWLEAGGVTGENVDPSVYGFANGGAVRRMAGYDDGGEVQKKDPFAPVSSAAGGTGATSGAPALKPVGAVPLEAKSFLPQPSSGAQQKLSNLSTTPKSSVGVPTPTSGSYEAQRNYARQTGAMNIPAPAPEVKPPPLPSSNTLAQGSAAWSRSYAGEQQQKQQGAMARMTEDSGQSTIKPAALPSSATQAQSGAMNRMTALGGVRRLDETAPSIKSRAVEGAPGVRRYDQPGQSPLYSNVADPWDDKGGISTIPSQHMQNPSGAVSRMVGPALQAAADRGDFRAVRQHFQRGNGVFGGETAEQTALRRLTEPSGSVAISRQSDIDAEQSRGAIDRMTREITNNVRAGNYRGAKVLQDAQEGMMRSSAAGQRNEIDRQTRADVERAGRVTDLRTAVQQQEQGPVARTDLQIKQAALAEQERKNGLMSRITGTDRDDAAEALRTYRQLYNQQETVKDRYMVVRGGMDENGIRQPDRVFDSQSGGLVDTGGGATAPSFEKYAEQIRAKNVGQVVSDEALRDGYRKQFGVG